jgi:peptide/nickel transport system permease protein
LAKYIIKRILSVIPVFIIVAFVSFCLVGLYPGDFFTQAKMSAALAGNDPETVHSALRSQAGIDKPFIVQFWVWLVNVVTKGDFGVSFYNDVVPVNRVLFSPESGIHWTLLICGCSMVLAWLFGVPLGILSAVRHKKWQDIAISSIAYIGISIPAYTMSYIFFWMMFTFINPLIISGGVWGLVNYNLVGSPMSVTKFFSYVVHLMPAFVIVGAPMFAAVVRYMKVNMMDTLSAQYLETARAKGVNEFRVIMKHATRNAFNPLVSLAGIMLPTLITGTILCAKILGLPSFGTVYIYGIQRQDQHLLTAALLFYSSILIFGNLIADLLLIVLDPRIRYT